ncbi:variant-specific surface protein 1 [Plasmodium falciparum RAJ116]|uniref:Variant-specific surface protein 1 n=1 Tax=Plasmodium falciparum RAJ116 TaxID=580058 RepID=A0A0L0CXH7_PLAFA|nr:variant-specific surface protein 1 [Plasmodium falciparum RAJ116]
MGKLVIDKGCINCLYACNGYQKWIDSKKEEFLKQKQKYLNEISSKSRKKRSEPINKYEGYDRKFYDEFKSRYKEVDEFLDLLNKEKECTNITDKDEGKIDFKEDHVKDNNTVKEKGTFYRSKYCELCPVCGVDCDSKKCTARDEESCPKYYQIYTPKAGVEPKKINVLISGEGHDDIKEKLEKFCQTKNSDSKELNEEWKCYDGDEVRKDGVCLLEKKIEGKENGKIQKSFYDFVKFWVGHMLKDSIYWRTEKLSKCLQNGKTIKCKDKCKDDCECFERWVKKKKEEWGKVLKQYDKQVGFDNFDPYETLEMVLKLEFYEENSEDHDENAKETVHIKNIFEEKENQGTVVEGTQKKNIIDFLIGKEFEEAQKCKNCQDPKAEGAGRILPAAEKPIEDEDSEDEDHGPDDHDGDSHQEEEDPVVDNDVDQGETTEDTEGSATEELPEAPTQDEVNPCKIVAELFKKPEDFKEVACQQKYGLPQRHWGWKCVPTSGGEPTTSTSGAICLPPRRRKLYIQKLHDWAIAVSPQAGGEAQPQGDTTSQSDKLRDAFIKTAVIETFFLWDRYKKENTKKPDTGPLGGYGTYGSAHYSGVPFSKSSGGMQAVDNGLAPKLPQIPNGAGLGPLVPGVGVPGAGIPGGPGVATQALGGVPSLPPPQLSVLGGLTGEAQPLRLINGGEQTPEKMLQSGNIPPDFLKLMFYTLGDYRDICIGGDRDIVGDTIVSNTEGSGSSKTKISDKIKEILEKVDKKQPGVLPQNSVKDPKTWWENNAKHIWEEWGENFCKERKKRLEKIKEDCRGGEYTSRYNDGDGFDCEKKVTNKDVFLEDFNGSSCATSCSFYKKWIRRKKDEYEEQEKKYKNERTGAQSKPDSISDNDFVQKLKHDTSIKLFLQNLGPCTKNDNDNREDNKIDFNDKEKTFGHENYCDPCPLFGVKYEKGVFSGAKEIECAGKTFNGTEDIEQVIKRTEKVDILVSDNSIKEFEDDLDECVLPECADAGIFKGFREDEWKCGKLCDYDVCVVKIFKDGIHNKKNVLIRTLFKRWLEYFLKDYIEIQKKLKPCMNDKVSICKNKCGNKCKCVEQWITKKQDEWKKIRDHYLEPYKSEGSDKVYKVQTFLGDLIPRIHLVNDKGKISDLDTFLRSYACKCANISEKKGEKKDIVECLLDKLEEKATSCKQKQQNGGSPEANCGESSPLPDDEEPEDILLEEEEENTVEAKKNMMPKICEDVIKPEPVEPEETCDASPGQPDVKEEEEEKEEEKDKGDEEQEAPHPAEPPAKGKKEKPKQRRPIKPPYVEDPLLKPSLMTSTLAWSVGIGFAAFTYFFLKKKTKSSVGNLFQILQIPKGDYDIPTLKSSNRYIPYASDRYKGKTYIYMEGDSSGDEKYAFMSDTTDVTSSESEYEELDINDIYVPGSPKYKTLIEVVLEPSKRDTPSDDIPSSDTPMNKFTDDEWNQLKHDFISNMLQNTQNTEPNILHDNVDNNTHPTMSRHNVDQKPFIMSIHDRNLYIGEEYNYDMFNSGNNPINISDSTNSMDSLTSNNHGPYNDKNDLYSGIDLINDALSGNHIDIYDEMLKRKENELFGTQHHPKNITSNRVVTQTSSDDPLHNQLNLFHKWLDRHRDMCEKWKNNHERLPKLKELWENETHSGDINSGIPSGNHVLNTDVSIQIDMNNPKYINQFTYVDSNPNVTLPSNPNLVENQNPNLNLVENNINPNHQNQNQVGDTNFVDTPTNPTNVQIEMSVKNTQMMEENYPIEDVWYI